ncbi:MAG: hypothetical protein WC444_06985 [Candidatus Paceibacterota bacterium]
MEIQNTLSDVDSEVDYIISHSSPVQSFDGVNISNKTRLNAEYGKTANNGGNKMTEPNYPQTAEPKTELSLDADDLKIAQEVSEDAPKKKRTDDSTRELGIDEMGGQWIKNPVVGESTEMLTIEKVMENKKIDAKRADGQAFKTNLSSVDYKIDIYTDKGIFCPSCWEVWGKVKAAIKKNKDLTGQVIKGTKFSVKHVVNGLYAAKPAAEVRKLLELPNTPEGLAAAEKAVQEAKDAQKNKKCYEVTLYVQNPAKTQAAGAPVFDEFKY